MWRDRIALFVSVQLEGQNGQPLHKLQLVQLQRKRALCPCRKQSDTVHKITLMSISLQDFDGRLYILCFRLWKHAVLQFAFVKFEGERTKIVFVSLRI